MRMAFGHARCLTTRSSQAFRVTRGGLLQHGAYQRLAWPRLAAAGFLTLRTPHMAIFLLCGMWHAVWHADRLYRYTHLMATACRRLGDALRTGRLSRGYLVSALLAVAVSPSAG